MRAGELDAETLTRARAGDPRAFRALYEHHADAVYAFLRRMLPHGAAAEDALQDAFLRVLGALRGFDPRLRLGACGRAYTRLRLGPLR